MNSNQIKLNSKDINKVPPELIYNITLKNGYILIIDDSIPSKNIYDIFNYNYNKENNSQYKSKLTNKSININTNNSFKKDINGKTLDINDSYLFNQNIYKSSNYSNNFFYTSNPNNLINNNDTVKSENKAVTKDVKYENQSISDLVTEKLQKRFHSNSKIDNSRFKTTINSEINLNIKGDETKKKYENSLLKDFDELLLNFNDKKKGLNILNISNNSKKKYKFYKKFNTKKNEKLLLDDLSGISSVTKAIKYIRRNEQNNTIINTEFNRNNLGINRNNSNKLSYLKEKTLKRNKSNNFYLVKNNKIINDILSPPNNLPYSKVLFMQNK
jgi:hypothetical protein